MLNKVQFIGHLGRDPEVRYLPSGDAVCNFSVASTERWKDKQSGEQMEKTEWLRCKAFGKLAEVCGEYLRKGSLVFVEGKLETSKYNDKDGVEKFSTDCRLDTMRMLGGRDRDAEGEAPARPAARAPAPRTAPAQAQRRQPAAAGSGFDDMDDDIPF